MSHPCRGCDGTCCTGVSGYLCTCPPRDEDMTSELSRVLDALLESGADMVEADGSRFFQCPAHEDRRASLSVFQGEKGVLIKCHAGCETEEILDQLGLKWADLLSKSGKGEQ